MNEPLSDEQIWGGRPPAAENYCPLAKRICRVIEDKTPMCLVPGCRCPYGVGSDDGKDRRKD